MSELIKKLTDENYEQEVLNAASPVVIDFYADWCGPCQMMGPVFDELAKEYEGKVQFAKVNIDEQRKLAMSNKVMSIPTLLFFKDGKQVDRVTGALDKVQLEGKVETLL